MEDMINIDDIRKYINNNVNIFREDVKILSKKELKSIEDGPAKSVLSGRLKKSMPLRICFICDSQNVIDEICKMIDETMSEKENTIEFKIETTCEDAVRLLFNEIKEDKKKKFLDPTFKPKQEYKYIKLQIENLGEFMRNKWNRHFLMMQNHFHMHIFIFWINFYLPFSNSDFSKLIPYHMVSGSDRVYLVRDLKNIYLQEKNYYSIFKNHIEENNMAKEDINIIK